jgi:hypothetical protein
VLARHVGAAQIGFDARADRGEGLRKRDRRLVFIRVADLAPAFVVAILFASARVARRRLDVAVRERTNPHVFVGRRNRDRRDACDLRLVRDLLSGGIVIREPAAYAGTAKAGRRIVDVAKAGRAGVLDLG